MLSERPYLRGDYQRERTPFLIWLLSATIAGFVIQLFCVQLNAPGFEQSSALSGSAIKRGYFWSLLTYPFLHRSVLHLVAVGLSLFFIGRELVSQLGERSLAWLALAAACGGGLMWFAFHSGDGTNLMGATAILWCYFTVFACLYPNREISFLVFFVIPVRLRPKFVALTMLGVDLFGFVFTEVSGREFSSYDVPHSAHLGAMLTGWLFYRYFHESRGPGARSSPAAAVSPRAVKRAVRVEVPAVETAASTGASRHEIRAELDRILDKINSHGFGALTPAEKRVLDDAKDFLSRR